jgi:hypothetical protein
VFEFDDALGNWIGVFSENRTKPYRVFLRGNKVYTGWLQIVCLEAPLERVGIEIDFAPYFRERQRVGRIASSSLCPLKITGVIEGHSTG